MLLQLDGTFLIIAISFIIFAFIMNRIFYSPVSNISKDREDYIGSNVDNAKAARTQAAVLLKEYEQKLLDARKQAGSIVSSSTAEANLKKAETVQSAVKQSNETIKQAKEVINNESDAVKPALKSEVISLAQMISSSVLGEERAISGVSSEMIDKFFETGM